MALLIFRFKGVKHWLDIVVVAGVISGTSGRGIEHMVIEPEALQYTHAHFYSIEGLLEGRSKG